MHPITHPLDNFGKRLLEKMGWRAGSGLGRNECGPLETIKATPREELQGIGCERANYLNRWSDEFSSFDSMLRNLSSSETSPPSKTKKLKHKKIHKNFSRKKHIESKNVSAFNDSDLREILGGVSS